MHDTKSPYHTRLAGHLGALALLVLLFCSTFEGAGAQETRYADPLPSWKTGAAKARILLFVKRATDTESPSFVPAEDRIAAFDVDGTLWPEKPVYIQVAFMAESIRAQAKNHPEWRTTQPFKAVLENDLAYLGNLSEKELRALFQNSHIGISLKEYRQEARRWLASSLHPGLAIHYTELVYQPMLELMNLLSANGFTIYLCSGSSTEFLQAFSGGVFGVDPGRVIGSTVSCTFQSREDGSEIIRTAESLTFNDSQRKPVNLELRNARRPLIAVGNSDGDLQMFEYTQGRGGSSLVVIVGHDDGDREFAYTRGAREVLGKAEKNRWLVVSMKKDFSTVFLRDRKRK